MDPRTQREKDLNGEDDDEDILPLVDPHDGWEDESGSQNETLDGMD
jgi:hypothetical protein